MYYEERFAKTKTSLKAVIVFWVEMWHFISCSYLGEELVTRGYEVTFITNNYGREKCTKMVEAFGAKCLVTNDSLQAKDLMLGAKDDYVWKILQTEI